MKKIEIRTIRSLQTLCIVLVIMLSSGLVSCSKNKTDEQVNVESLVPDSVYLQTGNKIVSLTFDTLRNSLMTTIGSKGIEEAIEFCNEKAYSITDTYGDSVVIRRTAVRYRNTSNQPDSLELTVLDEMNAQMTSGISGAKVIRRSSADEIHFFKPIILQAMCLNCHGAPGDQIQPSTLSRINQLYPDDRAVNFKEGDLRGVWHIIFKSTKKSG